MFNLSIYMYRSQGGTLAQARLFCKRQYKFKNCKTDAVIIRILTDVSAMLPSSGYTRLNTVRSSLNLAHVIENTAEISSTGGMTFLYLPTSTNQIIH